MEAPKGIDIKDVNLPTTTANNEFFVNALTIVFVIIGALSLLMIVIAGLTYVTSQGEPDKITKAKRTIIYAIAGLVISISSASIVYFVLGRL